MNRTLRLLGLFFFVLVSAGGVRANVTLPDVISSGMILQRDRAVPVWGTAEPGETVTVRFAGQARTATADKDGKWIIRLSALRANTAAATMTIEGKNKIQLDNVLVGEVWLGAGQSHIWRRSTETR